MRTRLTNAALIVALILIGRQLRRSRNASEVTERATRLQTATNSALAGLQEKGSGSDPQERGKETSDHALIRRFSIAALIIAIGLSLSVAAWHLYESTSQPVPLEDYNGMLGIGVPLNSDNLHVHLTSDFMGSFDDFPGEGDVAQPYHTLDVYFTGPKSKSSCVFILIGFIDGIRPIGNWVDYAPVSGVSSNARIPTVSGPTDMGFSAVTLAKVRACRSGDSSYDAYIGWSAVSGVYRVSGYHVSARAPEIFSSNGWPLNPDLQTTMKSIPDNSAFGDGLTWPQATIENLDGSAVPSSPRMSVEIDGMTSVDELRVDSGQITFGDSTIGWPRQTSNPTATMDATLTYLPGEADASRGLFVSGILAGAAFPFLLWGGQIILDSFSDRKRRSRVRADHGSQASKEPTKRRFRRSRSRSESASAPSTTAPSGSKLAKR